MSTTAKATLAASVLFCVASVVGVHYIQIEEKEVGLLEFTLQPNIDKFVCVQNLRAGVLRDDERRKKKEQRQSNMRELREQNELHEALLKTQEVSKLPSSEPASEDD